MDQQLKIILDRLRICCDQLRSGRRDVDLCKFLRISASTLSTWKARGTIPYEVCVEVARRNGVSLDWLLMGQGEMFSQVDALPLDEAMLGVLRRFHALEVKVKLLEKRMRELEKK